jgi:peptidoglycan glycosyltransferase
MATLRSLLRLLAAGGAIGLVAVGLRSGRQITDARWLAILGAAWLLLVVATWLPLPRTIPSVGRSTIRTAVIIATVFAVVAVQLLRIQIVTSEATVERVAVAPNGDVAGNPRAQVGALDVRRGRVYDRNGVLLADTVRQGEVWARVYPEPESAYVVGYYAPLQYGSAGLEASYDDELTGETGETPLDWLERDLLHRPTQGNDLILTLDAGLQRTAHELLDGRIGAAVLIDVETGAVLVLASNPHWDPNALFAAGPNETDETAAAWADLTADPDRPLVSRATLGRYPPGSTFKVVTAGAAIDAGFTDPARVYEDDGDLEVDGRVIVENNRPDPTQTEWTLTEGLAWSLNVVFAQVGLALGPELMREYAAGFGFGAEIPFDLPVEASQLEGTEGFVDNPVALADTAFGQGQLLVTPLQLALVATCYANGGTIPLPYLVDRVVSPGGQVLEEAEPAAWRQPVSPETAAQVAGMMVASVQTGYAAGAALSGATVGGKTGTAEAGDGEPHAWFIGFAGDPTPRYAVAVVLEHGGSGLAGALFVGRDLLGAALQTEQAATSRATAADGSEGERTNLLYVRAVSNVAALPESGGNARIGHARSGRLAGRTAPAAAVRAPRRPGVGRVARRGPGDARQRRGRRRGRTDARAGGRRPRPRRRRGRPPRTHPFRALRGGAAGRARPGLFAGPARQDHDLPWSAGASVSVAASADARSPRHRRPRAGTPPRVRRRPP